MLKICKRIVDEEEKLFGKIEENIFGKAIIPSENTFSDLYNDTKIKALAVMVPEIMTKSSDHIQFKNFLQ